MGSSRQWFALVHSSPDHLFVPSIMKSRRDFIKTGLALGATLSLVSRKGLAAAEAVAGGATAPTPAAAAPKSVLVAVRDGSRTAMLDQALAALGGIGAFVKPGQTVLVKPN